MPKFTPNQSSFSLRKVFDKRLISVACIGGIAFMGASGMYSYSTLYAEEIGLSDSVVSLSFIMFSLSLLATRLFNSKSMDKHGPKLSGAISLLLFSLGLGTFGVWQTLPGFLTGATILGAGMGIILPTVLSMVMELVPPNQRGIGNGLVYTGTDIGMSLGGVLYGNIAQIMDGYSSAYLFFSIVDLLSVLLFLFFTFPYYSREKKKMEQFRPSEDS